MTNSFVSRTARAELSNGIKLLVLENHANPTVSISGYLLGGAYFSPVGKYATARLTADMLNKGTHQRSKLEIAEALESAGAGVSVSGSKVTGVNPLMGALRVTMIGAMAAAAAFGVAKLFDGK